MSARALEAKHEKILKELVRRPENKRCADCDTTVRAYRHVVAYAIPPAACWCHDARHTGSIVCRDQLQHLCMHRLRRCPVRGMFIVQPCAWISPGRPQSPVWSPCQRHHDGVVQARGNCSAASGGQPGRMERHACIVFHAPIRSATAFTSLAGRSRISPSPSTARHRKSKTGLRPCTSRSATFPRMPRPSRCAADVCTYTSHRVVHRQPAANGTAAQPKRPTIEVPKAPAPAPTCAPYMLMT